jgi:hypothetical protein
MTRNFHEGYDSGEVRPPSDRSTGLAFAAVAAIVALLWNRNSLVLWPAMSLAVVLAVISVVVPTVLRPLNVAWFQLGMLMHRIVNPVLLFIIFALVFVPGGIIMRIWRDPLRSQRLSMASSYWIQRKKDGDHAGSMSNQF